ncbi:DUF3575 domain-containing protein [Parabacteroides faecis]|nr:DUF3575 domain-containing protein [Parabacteroides faecis]MCS2893550.1 DUF3575 domain-containing protein [Parabacteroides faecis]
MIRRILFLLLLCSPAITAAQSVFMPDSLEGALSKKQIFEPVYFRIGQSMIDPDFKGNRGRLSRFVLSLQQILADSNYVVSRVVVTGMASPEGAQERNLQLASDRAKALSNYILQNTILSADRIKVINGGENWNGLRAMIETSHMRYRSEMLRLMDRYPDDRDARKHAMQYWAESEAWKWMYQYFFPSLRMSAGYLELSALNRENRNRTRQSVLASDIESGCCPVLLEKVDRISDPVEKEYQQPCILLPRISLKTDLMLWGGVMPGFKMGTWTPNLSAEIYFGRHWSGQAGYAYSNWNTFTSSKELYALSAAELEVRSWLGKTSWLQGFYLGLYGTYGEYDVQLGVQGQTGSFWAAGIGAGYMQPLSMHWGLEIQVRSGYRSVRNNQYDIEQEHYYFARRETKGLFSPQVRLQLVYRFGKQKKD